MTETKTTETKTDNQKLSFAELLEQTEKTFKPNTVVKGKIIKILPEVEKVVSILINCTDPKVQKELDLAIEAIFDSTV